MLQWLWAHCVGARTTIRYWSRSAPLWPVLNVTQETGLQQYLAVNGVKLLGRLHTTDHDIRKWFHAPGKIQTCASNTTSDWANLWREHLQLPALEPACAADECLVTPGLRVMLRNRRQAPSQLWGIVHSLIVGK